MDRMIERVARAIYHGQERNRPWDILPENFRRQHEKLARAAIEAMREPNTQMRLAAVEALSDVTVADPKAAAWDACRAYRSMINAALSEPPSSQGSAT